MFSKWSCAVNSCELSTELLKIRTFSSQQLQLRLVLPFVIAFAHPSNDLGAANVMVLTVVTIDPKGNVVLVARDQDIVVSSNVLSSTSDVFKTMFKPTFSEDIALAANGKCRIQLPEDDPRALGILCIVLHYPRAEIEFNTDPVLFHKIALLANKYQCGDTLYYWVKKNLDIHLNDDDSVFDTASCLRLLEVAFITKIPCLFKAFTFKLLFCSPWTRNL